MTLHGELTSAGVLLRLEDAVGAIADEWAAPAFGDVRAVLLAPELSTSIVGTACIRMAGFAADAVMDRLEWLGTRVTPPVEESGATLPPPLLCLSFSLAPEVNSFESLFMMSSEALMNQ